MRRDAMARAEIQLQFERPTAHLALDGRNLPPTRRPIIRVLSAASRMILDGSSGYTEYANTLLLRPLPKMTRPSKPGFAKALAALFRSSVAPAPRAAVCDFLGAPTRTSTRPPDNVAIGVPQIWLGPARTGLRLVATFQVFAQLADLDLDAACSVHRYPGFVVPVPGVGQVAFDAVDEPVNPPGDRVVQILHQRVSGRPIVSQKALDRVRKLLGVRSFHGVVGTWMLRTSAIRRTDRRAH